ncbi:MAG: hypothetical protein ABIH70_06285 [Chloroflexota bacterium]
MKKLWLLCLAVVAALGLLGVGYARWQGELYLQGEINTGEVEVCIESIAPDDHGIDPGYDKDVAWVEVWVDPNDCSRGTATIHNAYPCYTTFVHFTTLVGGTVPVRLQSINIVNPNPCVEVLAWDTMGEQRHPGEHSDNAMSVHVLQCAEQNATYTFSVEFVYVQYNEWTP